MLLPSRFSEPETIALAGCATIEFGPCPTLQMAVQENSGASNSKRESGAAAGAVACFLRTIDRWETGFGGWRSSADGPLLCPFSLLTGNFTGILQSHGLWERQRPQIMA